MNWHVVVDAIARKQLKRIPTRQAERLFIAIREFAINPYAGDIEKLEGEPDVWRRRIGSYRIFYEVHQGRKVVYVFKIKRRTSNTY